MHLSISARGIVEGSLQKRGHTFEVFHQGVSMSLMDETAPAYVTVWRLGPECFVVLVIRDGFMVLTGFPGLSTTEEFGAINSLEFYLGADDAEEGK